MDQRWVISREQDWETWKRRCWEVGGDRGTERGMGNQVAPAPSPSALSSGGSDSDESWAEWGWEGHPLFSHSSQSLVGRVESHRFRM